MTWRAFRDWRRCCPFLAGLVTVGAGLELMVVVGSAPGVVRLLGRGAAESWTLGVLLVVAGVTMWFTPALRYFAGSVAIVAGLLSLVFANLGGYLVGFLCAVLGGALAVAWRPVLDGEPVGSR